MFFGENEAAKHQQEKETPFVVLLMEEILHQLIGSFPIIYRVSYIPAGAGFQPSTVLKESLNKNLPDRDGFPTRRLLLPWCLVCLWGHLSAKDVLWGATRARKILHSEHAVVGYILFFIFSYKRDTTDMFVW